MIKPRLKVLTPNQKQRIHDFSLSILETTGVRVDSKKALAIFGKSDGTSIKEDRVRFSRELIEWAIRCAPPVIDIYNRKAELAFRLGADAPRFGIGVTALYYQKPEDDSLIPFTRNHMRTMVRLGETLPQFDVVSTVGILQDIQPEQADLVATLEMIANTTKPLVMLISGDTIFAPTLDMIETLHGALSTSPFLIPYFNPVSPLIMNAGTTDKMFETIHRGLPFIYSNYSMAGMSTPITPGGTMALLNAELLAGLVFAQLIKPGTPIILGMLPVYFDMKTMLNFYDPSSILINLACAEMMSYYRIPHCGTSGSGTGWGADLISADTSWMNQITACSGQVGLAPFIGDILGSKAFSPMHVVYSNEIIDQARRFAEGFKLDQTTVSLGEIADIGPGGNFLTTPLTLQNYKSAYYPSPIFPHYNMERWQAKGSPSTNEVLRTYTVELLNNLSVPNDCDELIRNGEIFIRKTVGTNKL